MNANYKNKWVNAMASIASKVRKFLNTFDEILLIRDPSPLPVKLKFSSNLKKKRGGRKGKVGKI